MLPISRVDCLLVDPARRLRVAKDLHVVLEFLRPDRPALLQELLDLAQHERGPLERSGMVGFKVPYVIPELLGFERSGKAAVPSELVDRRGESLVHRDPGGPASRRAVMRSNCHRSPSETQQRQISRLSP
jgi:hypothetical protein